MIEGLLLGLTLVVCLMVTAVRWVRQALARLRVAEQADVGVGQLVRRILIAVLGRSLHRRGNSPRHNESGLVLLISRIGLLRPHTALLVRGFESGVILVAVLLFVLGAWFSDLEYGTLGFLVVSVGGYVLPRAVLRNMAETRSATLHRGLTWFGSTLQAARASGDELVLFTAIEQWRRLAPGTAMGILSGELTWLVTCGVGLDEAIERLRPHSGGVVADGLKRLHAAKDHEPSDAHERETLRSLREDVRIGLEHRTARISSVLASTGILVVLSGLALVWGTVGW